MSAIILAFRLECLARIAPLFLTRWCRPSWQISRSSCRRPADELGRGLHPESAAELADLVRVTNSYYSNLIEGHNTRPRDIESALAGAEIDPERRPLALEAKAHVHVQRVIDGLGLRGDLPTPTSIDFIRWAHRAFYDEMPEEYRFIEKSTLGNYIMAPPLKVWSLRQPDSVRLQLDGALVW